MNNAQQILTSMPLSPEILKGLNKNTEIIQALKLVYPEKYLRFNAVSLPAASVLYPDDEIVGIILYDTTDLQLDQDFIVVDGKTKEIFLYSGLDKASKQISSRYVRHINKFLNKYGANGDFADTHHPKLASLDPSIQERVRDWCTQNGFKVPA